MSPKHVPLSGSWTRDDSTRRASDATGADRLPIARTSSGSCGFRSARASGERPPRVLRFRPLHAAGDERSGLKARVRPPKCCAPVPFRTSAQPSRVA